MIAYAYSTAICAQMKLFIVIGVLAVGVVGYTIVEILQFRKVSFFRILNELLIKCTQKSDCVREESLITQSIFFRNESKKLLRKLVLVKKSLMRRRERKKKRLTMRKTILKRTLWLHTYNHLLSSYQETSRNLFNLSFSTNVEMFQI